MTISVTPEVFNFVSFDASLIREIAEGLVTALALDEYSVAIEVDETTPLARLAYQLTTDTISIQAQSGAFEDTRKPRQQSELATAIALGRALLKAKDRATGGFADAPADEALSLAQGAAWDVYALGRLERLGIAANQQRWRYNFRNRHGFSDRSDAAFDHLWASDSLTWDVLDKLSTQVAS